MFFEQVMLFAAAILVLGVLIFVHELGHFLVAKLSGVGVFEFSVGFGRKMWRKRWGDTYYAMGIIPLGGYVRMCGDDPYESGANQEETSPQEEQAGVQPQAPARPENMGRAELSPRDLAYLADESKWFLKKGFRIKSAIVLAGPLANFLFALLLAVLAFWFYGKPAAVNEPRIGEVFPGYPAAQAGLKSGDLVQELNGRSLQTWDELSDSVRRSGGEEMELKVERASAGTGELETLIIKLSGKLDAAEIRLLDDKPERTEDKEAYKIGIFPQIQRAPVSLKESLVYGSYHVWYLCRITVRILVAMVRGVIAPSKVVGGPIAVFAGAAKSAGRGLEALLDFMVLLGVSLAIFNLLPIPILDGGHLVFFIIEFLKGSPVGVRWQALANQVGMAILIVIMGFALYNDVLRLL